MRNVAIVHLEDQMWSYSQWDNSLNGCNPQQSSAFPRWKQFNYSNPWDSKQSTNGVDEL